VRVSGGNAAIKWNQPENLQRTNDVLVYLAKNLTAVNNTEDYKGASSPPHIYRGSARAQEPPHRDPFHAAKR
jgi:hypothetical protein